MITAVDSNVLIDIFEPDPTYGLRARDALKLALVEGEVVACDVVWAEVAATFGEVAAAESALQRLGIRFSGVEASTASAAGAAWRSYRQAGGARARLVADFLVGAHAARQAERLLTRDRGFYRSYFKHLTIIDPARR